MRVAARPGVDHLKKITACAVCVIGVLVGRTAEAAGLTVGWDPPADEITTGYVIGYGPQSGNYTNVVDVGAKLSFTVSGLADGTTYYLAVRAYSATGALSSYSVEVSGSTPSITPGPNTPPTISQIPSQIVPKGTKTVGPLPFTITDLQTPAAVLTLTAATSDTTYLPLTGISLGGSGNTRTVTLKPRSGAKGSAIVSITVSDGQLSATTSFNLSTVDARKSSASSPTSLTATSSGDSVQLTWDSGSALAAGSQQGYRIEFGSAPASEDVAITTGITTRLMIRHLTGGQYYFRVRGIHFDGETDPSNEVSVTVVGAPGDTRAPQDLQVTLMGRVADIRWAPPIDGIPDGYLLEAGSNAGQSNLGSLQLYSVVFVTPELPDGIYFVRVRAVSGGVAGPPSSEIMFSVTGSAPPCVGPPGVPTLTGASAGSIIQLSWQPGAGAFPTTYFLQAGSAPGRSDLGTLALDSSTTSIGAPVPRGTYIIRVSAVNGCGASRASEEVFVTVGGPPPVVPGAPGDVWHEVSGSKVTLTWTPPSTGGEATSYVIEASDIHGNPLVTFDTGNPATTLSHSGVGAGTYVVRVRAANAAGPGPPTPPVVVTVP